MKRALAVIFVPLVFLGACENEAKERKGEGPKATCGPTPSALAQVPTLPSGFPTPDEVSYTSTSQAGPSTIVAGFWQGDLVDAFDGYKAAFQQAGYQVTKEEKEADDAEVNFSGGNSTGQVKLREECEGRTTLTITIRPS